MRDYLYISDAKVESYFGQLTPKEQHKVTAKIKVNVGIVAAEYGTERAAWTERIHRLEAVERSIRKAKPVGSVESDEMWIAGTANVVAAMFEEDKNVMFFFADSASLFLGLAGAAHHMIGNVKPATAVATVTHLPTLLKTLEAITTDYAFVTEKSDDALSPFVQAGVTKPAIGSSSWTSIMETVSRQFVRQPHQRVDFLARRLTTDTWPNRKRYTLATPLYVALDEVG